MSGDITLTMPKLGLTMTEGMVTEWLVNVGSRVRAGDIIYAVELDKSVVEVEAQYSGTITKILVPAGETVDVGATVGEMMTD
jgi:pyruvate dehydrogenase E2 component (dihydrolipoamide acetyltransferase)